MAQKPLAELLLRRKELQNKVDALKALDKRDLFEIKVDRKAAHEGVDDIVAAVPKMTMAEFTAGLDFYANRLRLVDAAIQRANWETNVEVDDKVWAEFREDQD
jgi:ABC-type metal ion transport system substrate-binding protein